MLCRFMYRSVLRNARERDSPRSAGVETDRHADCSVASGSLPAVLWVELSVTDTVLIDAL